MKNRTAVLTIVASAGLALLNILLCYYVAGGNPANRIGYGIFISFAPALAGMLWLHFRRASVAWQQSASTYVVFYVLVSTVQSYARLIPVHRVTQHLFQ